MGFFGSFKQAKQVIEDARKDVQLPWKDELQQRRDEKNNAAEQGEPPKLLLGDRSGRHRAKHARNPRHARPHAG